MRMLLVVALAACGSRSETPSVGSGSAASGSDPWSATPPKAAGGPPAEVQKKLARGAGRIVKMPSTSMAPTVPLNGQMLVEPRPQVIERGALLVFQMPCQPDREYVKRVVGVPGDTIEIRCAVILLNGKAVPRERVAGPCSVTDAIEGTDETYQKACSRFHETLGSATFDVLHRADLAPDAPDDKDFPSEARPIGCEPAVPNQAPLVPLRTTKETGACMPQLHVVVPAASYFVLGDYRNNSNDSRYWGVVPDALVTGIVTAIW